VDGFLTSVIAALVAGATAKAQDVGLEAVNDAYDSLKRSVIKKLGKGGAVQSVEDEPDSKPAQVNLAHALTRVEIQSDGEVKALTRKLEDAIKADQLDANPESGNIDIAAIRANVNVLVQDLVASGSIKIGPTTSGSDVTFRRLSAGGQASIWAVPQRAVAPSISINIPQARDVRISELRVTHPQARAASPQLSAPPNAPERRQQAPGAQVPFVGRHEELTKLWAFLNYQPPRSPNFAWWLWTASGGQGKTRLAAELCEQAKQCGWEAGFLAVMAEYPAWQEWIVDRPNLIIIDHVAGRAEHIRNAICQLSRSTNKLHAPVRFLLIERNFGPSDTWVGQLVPGRETVDHADFLESAYSFDANTSDELADVSYLLGQPSDDDLRKIFIAAVNDDSISHADIDTAMELLRRIDPAGRPLFVIYAARAIKNGGVASLRRWSRRELLQFVLRREFGIWNTALGVDKGEIMSTPRNLLEAHICLVVYASIAGRFNVLNTLDEYKFPTPARVLPEWLRIITGEADEFLHEIPPLQPDILAELFVLERASGKFGMDTNSTVPQMQTHRLLDIALAHSPHNTVDFVKRCFEDFPEHPSLVEFTKFQIPEKEHHYGYFEDYCVFFDRIAHVMHAAARPDLAEAVCSQIIEHAKPFLGDTDLRELIHRRMSQAYYNRAVDRAQLQNEPGAKDDLENALKYLPPRNTHNVWSASMYEDEELWASAYIFRAKIKGKEGLLDEAIEDVELVLSRRENLFVPAVAEAVISHAELLAKRGDATRAAEECEQVLQMGDAGIDAQKHAARELQIGLLWDHALSQQRSGDEDGALETYDNLVQLTDQGSFLRAHVRINRSAIYLIRGLYQECVEDCTSVMDDNRSPLDQVQRALLNRGQAYLRLHRTVLAEKDIGTLENGVVAPEDIWAKAMMVKAHFRAAVRDRAGSRNLLKKILNEPIDAELRRQVEGWLTRV
jgi:tetratricopeptide (TPR) repeat protein